MKGAESRMAKVLVSLVAAMTLGTFILHWFEPSAVTNDTGYAIQLRATEARQAVGTLRTSNASARWRGVFIRAGGSGTPAMAEPHFRVTSAGQIAATDRWHAEMSGADSGLIEVELEAPRQQGSQFSPRQATALVALLCELQRGFLAFDGRVQLDERSFAAGRSSDHAAPAQQIRELLHSAGMAS